MYNSIHDGFKDVWDNRIVSFVLSMFILIVTVTIVAASESYIYSLNYSEVKESSYTKNVANFEVYITSTDTSNTRKVFYELSEVYESNAFTFRKSDSLSMQNNQSVFLGFGDYTLIDDDLNISEKDVVALTNNPSETRLKSIEVLGDVIPVQYANLDSFIRNANTNVNQNGDVLIVSKGIPEKWIEGLSPLALYNYVDNTVIVDSDIERMHLFEEAIGNSFMDVVRVPSSSNEEVRFMREFFFPLQNMLIVTFMLSLIMILDGMITQKLRTLTIHYFYGGTYLYLLTRFTISLATLFVPAIIVVINEQLKGTFELVNPLSIIVSYLIILVIANVYALIVLKKADLIKLMRGN